MAKLLFNAVPIKLKIGEKARYRLAVRQNGQIGEKTFKKRVAKRCGYDESVVGCVMDGCGGQMGEELANGNRVDIGWLHAFNVCRGSADSSKDPWDPSKNRLVASFYAKGVLKECLDSVEMQNVTDGPSVFILHIADTEAVIDGTISGTTDVLARATGSGLKVDPDSPEEGIWLEDAKDVIVAVATVVEAASEYVSFRFAELPPDGTYTLVIASRNGMGEDFGVAMGRRKVTVCAVAGE